MEEGEKNHNEEASCKVRSRFLKADSPFKGKKQEAWKNMKVSLDSEV